MEGVIFEYIEYLLSADRVKALNLIENHFKTNNNIEMIEKIISNALEIIGERWETDNASLAQVYISGIITEEIIDQVIPPSDNNKAIQSKIAIGVLLDQHSLGKRIVSSIGHAYGYSIIDLGQGLTPEKMVDLAILNSIDILLISTLMLPSALKVKDVRKILNEKNSRIKLVVGGAPFRLNANLWKHVGADDFGNTGSDIKRILEKLVIK